MISYTETAEDKPVVKSTITVTADGEITGSTKGVTINWKEVPYTPVTAITTACGFTEFKHDKSKVELVYELVQKRRKKKRKK